MFLKFLVVLKHFYPKQDQTQILYLLVITLFLRKNQLSVGGSGGHPEPGEWLWAPETFEYFKSKILGNKLYVQITEEISLFKNFRIENNYSNLLKNKKTTHWLAIFRALKQCLVFCLHISSSLHSTRTISVWRNWYPCSGGSKRIPLTEKQKLERPTNLSCASRTGGGGGGGVPWNRANDSVHVMHIGQICGIRMEAKPHFFCGCGIACTGIHPAKCGCGRNAASHAVSLNRKMPCFF